MNRSRLAPIVALLAVALCAVGRPWQTDAVPREVLIKYEGREGLEALEAAHAGVGARVLRDCPHIGWAQVRVPEDWSEERARAHYLGLRGVVHVEPNYRVQTTRTPNDPRYPALWGMPKIGMPAAWDVATGSADVVVAVIDSGVDYTHPDLAANMWVNPDEVPDNDVDDDGNGYVDDVHGINAADGTGDPMDVNGHGTHIAGTIGAVGNNNLGVAGVNWQVRLMALRFIDAMGVGATADAVACYDYLVAMRRRGVNVRVANNSWGGYGRSTALRDAIQRAGDAGVFSACAAGNEGLNADVFGMFPAAFGLASSISVAASDREDQPTAFTNYGRRRVDLAAPGVQILSTVPDARYLSATGTSMSTPHVAGAAALLLSQRPALTPEQVKAVLIATVDPVPGWRTKSVSQGRLNVAKALAAEPPVIPAP